MMNLVVLTGAGVSAESGIPTFRGEEGLWKNFKPEELATPEGGCSKNTNKPIEKFLENDIIFPMQSFQSSLDARCGANGRNPEDGKDFKILAIVQQVLKVALLFPVPGRKNTPPLPQGSVGQGEERVSSL
jgi:hypothetical protein